MHNHKNYLLNFLLIILRLLMSDEDLKNSEKFAKELNEAVQWVQTNRDKLPASVVAVVLATAKLKSDLEHAKNKAKNILLILRQQMGIIPKSERGEKLPPSPKTDEEKLKDLTTKRSEITQKINEYKIRLGKNAEKKVKKTRAKPFAESLEPPSREDALSVTRPQEQLFQGNLVEAPENRKQEERINRMNQFGTNSGLHATFDERKRHEFAVSSRTIDIRVETVTDMKTGKSVTASTDHIGPPGFQATWLAIANTIISVIGYAIPINRLAAMLKDANPYFTSSRLCSFLDYAAELMQPIYIYLGESLANADWLMGDDTKTKVLEISKKLKNDENIEDADSESRVSKVAKIFGRLFPKKIGDGHKRGLNVSVVIGKTDDKNPKSYVYFFRTHLGSLGDLLSKMFEKRDRGKKDFTLVSDLSTTNRLAPEFYKNFNITHAGCASHARRPIFRYKDYDEILCYWMLSAFLVLENIEDRIDEVGRLPDTILKYREKFSKKVWEAILRRAKAVVEGDTATYNNNYWPKSSELYLACNYVVTHYEELTRYISDCRLPSNNNLCERVLRWDKIMLDSSKFRVTEKGRLNIDILRTIAHSCSAAEVELKDYLYFVFKNRNDLKDHPEKYTPYAFACSLQK